MGRLIERKYYDEIDVYRATYQSYNGAQFLHSLDEIRYQGADGARAYIKSNKFMLFDSRVTKMEADPGVPSPTRTLSEAYNKDHASNKSDTDGAPRGGLTRGDAVAVAKEAVPEHSVTQQQVFGTFVGSLVLFTPLLAWYMLKGYGMLYG